MSEDCKESRKSSTSSSDSADSEEGTSQSSSSSSSDADHSVVDLVCKHCETPLQFKQEEDGDFKEIKIALKSAIDQHTENYIETLVVVQQSLKEAKIKLE